MTDLDVAKPRTWKELGWARPEPPFHFFLTGYLSQFFPSRFEVDGQTFLGAEQFMMYQKALLFGDEAVAQKILSARRPAEHNALGRTVRGFDSTIWERNREAIAARGIYAKCLPNADLKAKLLATAGRTLVVVNPDDCIWAIGLPAGDPRCEDPDQWRGLNLLGKVLMDVRNRLALAEEEGLSI